MQVSDDLRQEAMRAAQGALMLDIAFIGAADGLFEALAEHFAGLDAEALAEAAGMDPGYVARWCDAAYAFGLLDADGDRFRATPLGRAFDPHAPGTLMPFSVQAVLSGHMAERASHFMRTGERPGESVLAEREGILPMFGPMLEATFGPMFEQQILPGVDVFREVDRRGGLAVDLGCGNGWFLRRLARGCPHLRGVGLDAFEESIDQAERLAERDGVADRLSFQRGDLHHFTIDEPVDLIAMNRALHHVWDEKDNVFRILREHLKPGGAAVIWEPAWPADRVALRTPARRPVAFQNLAEHVQGNHFLRPAEIEDGFRAAGMEAETRLFADGREAVVVGRRTS
ncbi:MAG: class I SAM-dependent methyltransferase [Myxococcota bacterium]